MLSTHRRSWEDLAASDPLWAILSTPNKKNGRWDIKEFFQRGEVEIAGAFSRIAGLPLQTERALDFGCGVGRLTRALSPRFSQCVGVDISRETIEQARRLNADLSNCRFIVNTAQDLRCLEPGFDFIYTSNVLQHLVHEDSITGYSAEFLRLLGPGGLLVFQVPSYIAPIHRIQPIPRLYQFLHRVGLSHRKLMGMGLHPIRMAFVPKENIAAVVEKHGGTMVAAQDSVVDGHISTFYWVTR